MIRSLILLFKLFKDIQMNEEMEVDTAVPADNPGVHDPPVNDKLKPFVEQELTSAYSSTKITLT
jgi:hypothetical protein